ncbi:MAG TPA: DUF6763 family protein [Steroidobacteraceae bacterium]|nr:DUF6763 family protein [Steroidobacteraceae bacterium]
MTNKLKPVIARWYQRLDNGDVFEVVGVDEDDGFVDVQNFDGEVSEMTLQTWRELDLARVSAPEWHDNYRSYESDRNIASLNTIWDGWQKELRVMH